MNSRIRREKLLQEIRNVHRAYTTELAKKFGVSALTVHRDLQKFAQDGLVTLIHGGAALNEGAISTPSASARERQMQHEKNLIGRICANLIKEGNAIFLDTGSTALSIAAALSDRKNIAVITNSLPVMNVLSANKNIQLIALAGIYHSETKGFFGGMTERHIKSLSIDIAFLGIAAVSFESGLMTDNSLDCDLKLAAIESARKKILVTDHTKIGNENLFKICDLNVMNQIVLDRAPDEDFVKRAKKSGLEIIYPTQ